VGGHFFGGKGVIIIIICHSGLNKIAMGVIFLKENKMQKNLFATQLCIIVACFF